MEIERVEVRQIYSEAFKRQLIEEFLKGKASKMEIQRKYGVKFKSAIATWMTRMGYRESETKSSKLAFINRTEVAKRSNSSISSGSADAKIKLLEKQLEDERLRSELYRRMIDIAEKEYKIPIRKNSNTK